MNEPNVGANLKTIRELKGITQDDLAKKIGVTKSAIANWETGINGLKAKAIPLVCEALEVDANTLLGWDTQEKKIMSASASAAAILRSLSEKGLLDQVENLTDEQVKSIKLPKRQPKHLTSEQMELLRMACRDARDRAILETYYSTGCRVSELQCANLRDLNWAGGSLRVVGKGNKERTVYINERAAVHLKLYLSSRQDNHETLFCTQRGKARRMGVRAIQDVFERIGQDAGVTVKVHPHLMRHTVATTMLRNGTELSKIQRMLGHESPTTTQIYAPMDDASVHDAHRRCS